MRKKNRFITFFIIFFITLSFNFIHLGYNNYIIRQNNNITILNKEIKELNQKIIIYNKNEEEYRDTMERITQYISKTDSFLNIGGQTEAPEYSDPVIFNAILDNEEEDFTDLLSNTELFFENRAIYFDALPKFWPLAYSPILRITSNFGARLSPFTGKLQDHTGIDMVSTFKAKILATAPGCVLRYDSNDEIFGEYIIIDHDNGYRTHYAHMSEVYVKKGEKIERGQVIGRVGNTGLSKGYHLHYGIEEYDELTNNWIFINPIDFLREVIKDGEIINK